jgi:hypothetical protein
MDQVSLQLVSLDRKALSRRQHRFESGRGRQAFSKLYHSRLQGCPTFSQYPESLGLGRFEAAAPFVISQTAWATWGRAADLEKIGLA